MTYCTSELDQSIQSSFDSRTRVQKSLVQNPHMQKMSRMQTTLFLQISYQLVKNVQLYQMQKQIVIYAKLQKLNSAYCLPVLVSFLSVK
jgi:uncharacterized protein YjaZ